MPRSTRPLDNDKSQTKVCARCGRRMEWRKKWEKNWDAVRYCSDACRRRRPSDLDARIEASILDLLERRANDASICPSEVARAIAPDDWRPLMERVREAGRRLAQRRVVRWTQKANDVDPSFAKGPVRFRRGRAFDTTST